MLYRLSYAIVARVSRCRRSGYNRPMFIDQAIIQVRSGKGGDGCLSFRREKFIPKGGPDGGDGGKGGDIVLVTDENINTLLDFRNRRHWHAKNGQPGMGKEKTGPSADDLLLSVPPGTMIYDDETGELLYDLDEIGSRFVIAKGGKGGYGNTHFKSSTNQVPRKITPGEPGVERQLRLELKLLADVGLVGKPNAGKSTLLRAISAARPAVAAFPFTTLHPQLGIAELSTDRRLVFADIPGLIEGAASGAGLGHDFLRHVERTGILVHLLDIAPVDGSDPVENYQAIRKELAEYSTALADKEELIALNKIDLVPEVDRDNLIEKIAGQLGFEKGKRPLVLSGATGIGLRQVIEQCWRLTQREPDTWSTTR